MWQHPLETGHPFWNREADTLFSLLGSGPDGLREEDVQARLKPEKHLHPLLRELQLFLSAISDPLMLLLLLAVLLSAMLGERADALIVSAILLLSATLTWLLHSRAGRLIRKLEALISVNAQECRKGRQRTIPSARVVPGDVLLLKAGDILPADCLVLESNELHVNEAGFTGESFPVRKFPGLQLAQARLQDRRNALWKGSNIVSGSARALAVHCGEDALFAALVRTSGEFRMSGFERGLRDFGYFLLRITLVLSLLVLLLNFLKNRSLIDSALFSLALAIGMAPELLPAITTMAMSAGARRLLEKQVVVKEIQSIQNLGEISLLCTDKTGTLTEGSIRAAGFKNIAGDEDAIVQKLACQNACLSSGYSNPLEEALRKAARDVPEPSLKTGEIPYDFIRKRVSISIRQESGFRMICKGEFHSILQICSRVLIPGAGTAPLEDYLEQLTKFRQQSGSDGLRSILVAYRDLSRAEIHKSDESGMILAGFVLFEDPVKPGVSEVLNELHRMRVGLKILSGDSLPVVLSVASRIGMNNCSVITGPQLDASTADALAHILERNSLFAELEPRHKERIIRELRKKHILAYMGDGINDVSALHEADVGISVSNAAGIAIEASDFVLLKKDLSVIADGIREGRRTFANTLKYIYISTGSTFGNMFSVAMASLYLPFIPMLPKQILLTNFISDFPFLSVASDSVDPAQLQRPGRWRLSQIRNFMWVFGLHSSVFDWITFSFLEFGMHAAPTDFRTAWFMESVATELLILFVVRTHRPFYRSRPATGLLWLSIAAISCTFLLPFTPLAEGLGFRIPSLPVLGGISGILMAYLFTADALKIWFFRQKN